MITVRRTDVLPTVTPGQVWLFGRVRVRVVAVTVEQGQEWVDVGALGVTDEVRAVQRLRFEDFVRRIEDWDARLEPQKNT